MAYGTLVTKLTADLTELRTHLKQAEKLFESFARQAQSHARVIIASTGGKDLGKLARSQKAVVQLAQAEEKLAQAIVRRMKAERDASFAAFRQDEQLKRMARTDVLREQREREHIERARQRQIRNERDIRLEAATRGVSRMASADFRERERRSRESFAGLTSFFAGGTGRNTLSDIRAISHAEKQALREREQAARRLGDVYQHHVRRGAESARNAVRGLVDVAALLGGTTVLGGIAAFIRAGIGLNVEYEKAQFTLNETFLLATDVTNKRTGQILKGVEALQVASVRSQQLFKDVREVAAETTLTARELFQVVSENLGFALGAGLKPDRSMVKVVAQIAQLAKNLGLPGGERQLTQEVRALLSGEKLQGASVAKILDFTNIKEVQKLQKSGKFFEELQKRIGRALVVTTSNADKFQQVVSTLRTKFEDFIRIAFRPVFERLNNEFLKLRKRFTDKDIEEWGNRVGKILSHIFDVIEKFVRGGGLDLWVKGLSIIASHWKPILAIFVGWKALIGAMTAGSMIKDWSTILKDLALVAGAKGGGKGLQAGETLALGAAGAATQSGLLGKAGQFFGQRVGQIGGGASVGSRIAGSGAGRGMAALPARLAGLGRAALWFLGPTAATLGAALAGWEIGSVIRDQTFGADERQAQKATEETAQMGSPRDRLIRGHRLRLKALRRSEEAAMGRGEPLGQISGEMKRVRADLSRLTGEGVFGPALPKGMRYVPGLGYIDEVEFKSLAEKRRKAELKLARRKEGLETEVALAGEAGGGFAAQRREARAKAALDIFNLQQGKLSAKKEIGEIENQNKLIRSKRKELNRQLLKLDDEERLHRLKMEGEIADQSHDTLGKILVDLKTRIAEVRKSVREQEYTEKEGQRLIAAAYKDSQHQLREIFKDRRDAYNEAGDLARDFAEKVQDAARQQRDRQRELVDFELDAGRKRKDMARQVQEAHMAVRDAIRDQKRAMEDLQAGTQAGNLNNELFNFFDMTRRTTNQTPAIIGDKGQLIRAAGPPEVTESRSIRDRLERENKRRLLQERPSLTFEQRSDIAKQQAQQTLEQIGQSIQQPGGATQAINLLEEQGLQLSDQDKQHLARFGIRGGQQTQAQTQREALRQTQDRAAAVGDTVQKSMDAQEAMQRTMTDARRFPEELARSAIELRENFQKAVQDTAKGFREAAVAAENLKNRFADLGITPPAVVGGVQKAAGARANANQTSQLQTANQIIHGSLLRAGVNTKTLDPRVRAALGESAQLLAAQGSGAPTIMNVNFQMNPNLQKLLEAVATELHKTSMRMMPAR